MPDHSHKERRIRAYCTAVRLRRWVDPMETARAPAMQKSGGLVDLDDYGTAAWGALRSREMRCPCPGVGVPNARAATVDKGELLWLDARVRQVEVTAGGTRISGNVFGSRPRPYSHKSP
jgi:hypothetical protein